MLQLVRLCLAPRRHVFLSSFACSFCFLLARSLVFSTSSHPRACALHFHRVERIASYVTELRWVCAPLRSLVRKTDVLCLWLAHLCAVVVWALPSPLKPPACFSQAAYIAELEHRSEQGTTQPGFLRTVVARRRYCGRVRDLEEPQELLLQPTWQQEAGKTWTSSGGLEKTSCRTSKRKRSARSPLHAIQLRRASVFRPCFLSISECSTGVSMGRQYDYHHVSAAIWVTVVSARSRANQHSPADAGRKRCKARGCGFGAARGRGVCETAVLGWR